MSKKLAVKRLQGAKSIEVLFRILSMFYITIDNGVYKYGIGFYDALELLDRLKDKQ